MYNIHVNKRVRELRETKNVSQDRLAKLLGVSRSTYTRMENEDTFDYTHLFLLADEFEVSFEYLLGGDKQIADYYKKLEPINNHSIMFSDAAADLADLIIKVSNNDKKDNEDK